jgi:hypothetical protein
MNSEAIQHEYELAYQWGKVRIKGTVKAKETGGVHTHELWDEHVRLGVFRQIQDGHDAGETYWHPIGLRKAFVGTGNLLAGILLAHWQQCMKGKPLEGKTTVEPKRRMTLAKAAKKFRVAGLDRSKLRGQEDAFIGCLRFLDGIEKQQKPNRKYTSYCLKHLVEECSGNYVYEGTFILAALASGFTMEQQGKNLTVIFNISQNNLRKSESR